jgi:hypothetical protein
MPLTKEQRAAYGPEWPAISKRIRERAGNRCEQCKAPNGQLIARGGDVDAGTYMLEDGAVFDENDGMPRGYARGSEYDAKKFVKIVLTVAHLNHDITDNSPSNLACWCQMHHLRYDAKHHAQTARRTRAARSGQTDLGFKPCLSG